VFAGECGLLRTASRFRAYPTAPGVEPDRHLKWHADGTVTGTTGAPLVRRLARVDLVGSPLSLVVSERGRETYLSQFQSESAMDGNINTLFTSLATTIRNVSVAVGIFAFMWGALQYATSGGSPHQLEMGKTAMKASLIGVGAIVLAATLVGIVFGALGGGAAAAAAGG
jgi:Type IV secretion system pilin